MPAIGKTHDVMVTGEFPFAPSFFGDFGWSPRGGHWGTIRTQRSSVP